MFHDPATGHPQDMIPTETVLKCRPGAVGKLVYDDNKDLWWIYRTTKYWDCETTYWGTIHGSIGCPKFMDQCRLVCWWITVYAVYVLLRNHKKLTLLYAGNQCKSLCMYVCMYACKYKYISYIIYIYIFIYSYIRYHISFAASQIQNKQLWSGCGSKN